MKNLIGEYYSLLQIKVSVMGFSMLKIYQSLKKDIYVYWMYIIYPE